MDDRENDNKSKKIFKSTPENLLGLKADYGEFNPINDVMKNFQTTLSYKKSNKEMDSWRNLLGLKADYGESNPINDVIKNFQTTLSYKKSIFTTNQSFNKVKLLSALNDNQFEKNKRIWNHIDRTHKNNFNSFVKNYTSIKTNRSTLDDLVQLKNANFFLTGNSNWALANEVMKNESAAEAFQVGLDSIYDTSNFLENIEVGVLIQSSTSQILRANNEHILSAPATIDIIDHKNEILNKIHDTFVAILEEQNLNIEKKLSDYNDIKSLEKKNQLLEKNNELLTINNQQLQRQNQLLHNKAKSQNILTIVQIIALTVNICIHYPSIKENVPTIWNDIAFIITLIALYAKSEQ